MDLFATGGGQLHLQNKTFAVNDSDCKCNIVSLYMSWLISNFALAALIRCHCKSAFITVELEVNKIRERINAHMEKLITRKEAAKILGVSIATLDAARQSGLISYVQYVPNGCVYFTETALQEYVAKCTRKAKPAENNLTYRKPRSPKKKK